MKTLHLRALVGLLLLTLFSQTLLAAVRSVQCALPGNLAVAITSNSAAQPSHCHQAGHAENVAMQHSMHHHTAPATDASAAPDTAQHSPHCQPDCSCCWNACSASVLINTLAALTPAPQSEQYRTARAELPAAPVEQSLRPPRFA